MQNSFETKLNVSLGKKSSQKTHRSKEHTYPLITRLSQSGTLFRCSVCDMLMTNADDINENVIITELNKCSFPSFLGWKKKLFFYSKTRSIL
jgi:hypothetical protein